MNTRDKKKAPSNHEGDDVFVDAREEGTEDVKRVQVQRGVVEMAKVAGGTIRVNEPLCSAPAGTGGMVRLSFPVYPCREINDH